LQLNKQKLPTSQICLFAQEVHLFITAKGGQTLLHRDPFSNIHCVFNGTKDWILLDNSNVSARQKMSLDNAKVDDEQFAFKSTQLLIAQQNQLVLFARKLRCLWSRFYNPTWGDVTYLRKFFPKRPLKAEHRARKLLFIKSFCIAQKQLRSIFKH